MASHARTVRALLLLPVSILVPALALAQQPTATTGGQTGTPPAPPPAPPTVTASASAAPVSTGPVSGYGWGGDARPAARPVHRYWAPSGPTAVLPGFEPLADGASRFFVELTKNVQVEERKGSGTITYVLKGAHVAVYNNYRPLVTVHFNTPVWRARLVPRGADLLFILEMRAVNVAPTFRVDAAPNGMATLEVDFPAGQFHASDMPELPVPGPAATVTPAPASSH